MKDVAQFIIIAGSGLATVYVLAIIGSWLEYKCQTHRRRKWQQRLRG